MERTASSLQYKRSGQVKRIKIVHDNVLQNDRLVKVIAYAVIAAIILLAYFLCSQIITMNIAKVKYSRLVTENQAILTEINNVNEEIKEAKKTSTIEVQASKKLGMIRRNAKNAIILEIPEMTPIETHETVSGDLEQFSFIAALSSIF